MKNKIKQFGDALHGQVDAVCGPLFDNMQQQGKGKIFINYSTVRCNIWKSLHLMNAETAVSSKNMVSP